MNSRAAKLHFSIETAKQIGKKVKKSALKCDFTIVLSSRKYSTWLP